MGSVSLVFGPGLKLKIKFMRSTCQHMYQILKF